MEKYGFDPTEVNEVSESAPGLLVGLMEQNSVDAVMNYADTNIIQASSGQYTVLLNASDCFELLGLSKETPFLMYTFTKSFADANPETVKAFVDAYKEAVDLLMEDDALWADIAADCFELTDETGVTVLRDTLRPLILKEIGSDTEQQCVDMLNWCLDRGYGELVGIEKLPEGFVQTP
jgi:NitT/TauT family transport system substrate-binding protein